MCNTQAKESVVLLIVKARNSMRTSPSSYQPAGSSTPLKGSFNHHDKAGGSSVWMHCKQAICATCTNLKEHFLQKFVVRCRVKRSIKLKEWSRATQAIASEFELVHGVNVGD
eukprot:m.30927 g.30927  ORF g.30927 m.30927 type:complete len:112 (-) comp12016_c0_seq3:449-784(-)